MKKYLAFVVSFVLLVCVSLTAYAHAGSTDEYGGHIDWSTGEYHYHHGYPAHSHDGGYCPYEFVDNADHSNNGYSGSNNYDYNYGDRKPYLPDEQYPLVTPAPSSNLSAYINSITSQQNKAEDSNSTTTFEYIILMAFLVALQMIPVFIYDHWSASKDKVLSENTNNILVTPYSDSKSDDKTWPPVPIVIPQVIEMDNHPSTHKSTISECPQTEVHHNNEHISVNNNIVDPYRVYWTPKGKTFHSTDKCITLRKSSIINQGMMAEAFSNGCTKPCSKCVGENYRLK